MSTLCGMDTTHNATGDVVDNPKDWIDVLGNGLLKKKILKCGNVKLERPGNGQNVKIWVKIMHENGDVILGRQRLSFTINGKDVIKALEICVPLMYIQEKALILTDSKFCSGRASSEASEMKPGSRLLLEVHLLSISGTRLEVKPKADQLKMIMNERQKGNCYFQTKNYKLAILCYTCALTIIDANTKDVLDHEDEKSFLDEKVKCYSNIAACHLNTGNLEEAFSCCDIVLQHQPQHCKALFRKGKVLELQEKYFLSIKFLRKASQVEPANQEIERELKLVFDKWAEKSEGASNAKTMNACPLFLAEDSNIENTNNHSETRENPEECQEI
ncbi:peptidyl-prolyl cis-trans isomerase FKBP8-like [Scyliorhinus canicula]|uniref:peptidyl-prolyl cis-trans isomerase FKBP8-like n=1 Tax=Scyliorhinus canicula TaxID=7830 RepID=UPI0018F57241|nr:peptidyl-prolyl cis-trans isomerase FKBP8-like [Scyliorhinus canicula]